MSTAIQWCDETINPIVGCSRVPGSPGCTFCYAAKAAKSPRLQQFPQYQSVGNWNGITEFVESQLLKPLAWKKSKRIFVCSMSDLFHESTPDEWIDKVFAMMATAQQHIFQVLTKRPERMVEYLRNAKQRVRRATVDLGRSLHLPPEQYESYESCDFDWLLKNVWLGVSVENQKAAEERIPLLLKIPATVRFLSCEPLLEKVVLNPEWLGKWTPPGAHSFAGRWGERWAGEMYIDQVIVGGESGSKARPCHLDWVRSLVRECREAGVATFVKQLGSNPIDSAPYIEGVAVCNYPLKLRDRKGGDIAEFPEDLQIREFPQVAISEEAVCL